MAENRSAESELQEKIKAITAVFTAKLPEKLGEIGLVLQDCRDIAGDRESLDTLHRLLHTMAGSAGTFGFGELGQRARRLEHEIKDLAAGKVPAEPGLARLSEGVRDFLQWAAISTGLECQVEADTVTPPEAIGGSPLTSAGQVGNERDGDGFAPLIYLLSDDPDLARDVMSQLQVFGYEVVSLGAIDRLVEAIDMLAPDAIVLDLDLCGPGGAAQAERLKQIAAEGLPVVFISNDGGFAARLAAVHAGAKGYIVKPVDLIALSDRLEALTGRAEVDPYRILIVDDDALTADYYASILRSAGMNVKLLQESAQILRDLGEYRPELILMDVYMPLCSGIDLAKLIRMDSLYIDIPIVFLSSEDNFGRQLDAIRSGGDDFLNKSILPEHLISSLSSRAERYRSLRSLIMCDSLTGLYNHSAIKEFLIREISRARRSAASLSLAMVDLDFFKNVNDTYGHPVGDQVIRTLSRLLEQRLRRGDIVGRYGGEEFVVIFPETDAATAHRILEEVRVIFSKIRFHANQGDFTETFSAGIAGLTASCDADTLLQTADQGLYRAKHSGRNRIEIA